MYFARFALSLYEKILYMIKSISIKGFKSIKEQTVVVSTQSVTLVDNFDAENIIVADRACDASVFRRLDAESLDAWLND